MKSEVCVVNIKLRSDISELVTLAKELEKFGKTCSLSSKSIFELNLVLDELFTNLVNYGCGDVERYFLITIEISGTDLKLTVEDDGVKFNPLNVPAPYTDCSCDKRPEGGLGIHFIKKIMNSIEYTRLDGKNIITMHKDNFI